MDEDMRSLAVAVLVYGALAFVSWRLRRGDEGREAEPAGRAGDALIVGGALAGPRGDYFFFGLIAGSALVATGLILSVGARAAGEAEGMAGLQAWLVALALAAPLFAAAVWAGRHLARIATWTARATPDGIAVSGVLTEPRTGRWDDLVTIRHSTFRTWYDLEFRDRTRIPVLRKTRGLGDLLTVIRGQAPHALERIEAEPGEGA